MSQDDASGDTIERIKVWSSDVVANSWANSTNITRLDIQISNQAYISQFLNSFTYGSISSSPSGSDLGNFLLPTDPSVTSYQIDFRVIQASLTFFCSGACNYALVGVQPDGTSYCSTDSLGYVPIITTDFADFDLSSSQGKTGTG